jgi:hypothetical protein
MGDGGTCARRHRSCAGARLRGRHGALGGWNEERCRRRRVDRVGFHGEPRLERLRKGPCLYGDVPRPPFAVARRYDAGRQRGAAGGAAGLGNGRRPRGNQVVEPGRPGSRGNALPYQAQPRGRQSGGAEPVRQAGIPGCEGRKPPRAAGGKLRVAARPP